MMIAFHVEVWCVYLFKHYEGNFRVLNIELVDNARVTLFSTVREKDTPPSHVLVLIFNDWR